MSDTTSTGKWRIYFFISLLVIIVMLVMPNLRPWFWISLPFVVTTFAKALKIM